MLEFRYDENGLVMDGSPLTGRNKAGDWWLDGVKIEPCDLLEVCSEGEWIEVSAAIADYGYVVQMALSATDPEQSDVDLDLTGNCVGDVQLRWVARWFDGLTEAELQEELMELQAELEQARSQLEALQAPGGMDDTQDAWADVKAANTVRLTEYCLKRTQDRLAGEGATA